jgi:hypothetical protein
LTEPLECKGAVPFDAGCDGEWPLTELESASFFGVEPLETLANPFDAVCVPLPSGRILGSTKRLRLVGGLCSGPPVPRFSVPGSVLPTPSLPVTSGSAAVKRSPLKLRDLVGGMGDDRRRRRRELRVEGWSSTGTLCEGMVGSDGNTAARIEVVELGKEVSVIVG